MHNKYAITVSVGVQLCLFSVSTAFTANCGNTFYISRQQNVK